MGGMQGGMGMELWAIVPELTIAGLILLLLPLGAFLPPGRKYIATWIALTGLVIVALESAHALFCHAESLSRSTARRRGASAALDRLPGHDGIGSEPGSRVDRALHPARHGRFLHPGRHCKGESLGDKGGLQDVPLLGDGRSRDDLPYGPTFRPDLDNAAIGARDETASDARPHHHRCFAARPRMLRLRSDAGRRS